jgi:hypothetical protein
VVLTVQMHTIDKIETDALIVGFHEDIRPLKGGAGVLDWLLCGALSRLVIQKKIRGAVGDVALLTSNGKVPADKIFLVGLGPRAGSSAESLRNAAKAAAESAAGAGVAHAALDYFPLGDVPGDEALCAIREGLAEGAGTHPVEFALLAPDAAAFARMSRLISA